MLSPTELTNRLLEFIRPTYPNIQIVVNDNPKEKRQITFIESDFSLLFPKQRYHKLIHLIPREFYAENLLETIWTEIDPDENINHPDPLDDESINQIKDIILNILRNKVNFVSSLDKFFITDTAQCHGDFRFSKKLLTELGFSAEKQFDIFEVLMNEGGFCDCEILLNVFKESQYAKKHWNQRKNQ